MRRDNSSNFCWAELFFSFALKRKIAAIRQCYLYINAVLRISRTAKLIDYRARESGTDERRAKLLKLFG